jgi:hypothetical protein
MKTMETRKAISILAVTALLGAFSASDAFALAPSGNGFGEHRHKVQKVRTKDWSTVKETGKTFVEVCTEDDVIVGVGRVRFGHDLSDVLRESLIGRRCGPGWIEVYH